MEHSTPWAAQLREELMATVSEPGSLGEMERKVRQMLLWLGGLVLSLWLLSLEGGYVPEEVACRCGGRASYRRRRWVRVHTMVGTVRYRRAYYLCGHCGRGRYPLDERLGLRPNAMSAELERLAGLVGVQMPFGRGSAVFEALTLVSLSDQSLDKAAQAYGREVERQEGEWQAEASDEAALRRRARERPRPLRLYGSIDGTAVHTRGEGADPWRELKIGAWFEAKGQPPKQPEGQWAIKAENITYYTAIDTAAQFGSLLWATGVQRDAQQARELIFIADGAAWIWRLVEEHFPQAIQIVDWFHACEYLTQVAKVVSEEVSSRQAWYEQRRTDLWEGRLDAVIAACARHVHPARENDPAQRAVTYFTHNRHRMDYPTYRAQGYQIGSGTIESAAKQIGAQRMKVPGARWNLESARYVAKARAAFLSDQWETLAARRELAGRAA